jgi:polyisoprenoid-binding protein YceI
MGRLLRTFVLTCTVAATAAAQAPDQFRIDPAATHVTIQVGRSGIFGFAGHDHEVVAPAVRGEITLDRSEISRSRVALEFDATALKVTGNGDPPEDVPEVQRVMLSDRVLDVARYPSITFQSRSIGVEGRSGDRMTLRLIGDLTLHGVTRSVTVPVNASVGPDLISGEGKTTVRQTSFGIRPVTAGAGSVKVKDEVEVIFSISARR